MANLLKTLVVIKGIGKKGPYEFLTVKNNDKFNSLVVDEAKTQGVEVIDLTPKK